MDQNKMIDYSAGLSRGLINLLIKANEARQIGEHRNALAIYYEIIENFGESAEIDQIIAHCYFQLGLYEDSKATANFESAVQWANKAINLAPRTSALHSDLGQFCSIGTLDYEVAAQEYETALQLDPNNLRALTGGAALYGVPEKVVSMAQAISWLERAVKLAPEDAISHLNLGTLKLESGNSVEAQQQFIMALLCPKPLNPKHMGAIGH
jgi:tetratricopeptide (TPR) repeat protein